MITPSPAQDPNAPNAPVSLSPLATSASVAVPIVLPDTVDSVWLAIRWKKQTGIDVG